GGTGDNGQSGTGGGGAALGAVVFIRNGGSLTLGSDIPAGTVTAGNAGGGTGGVRGTAGEAFGTSVFINGNATLTLSTTTTQTVSGTIVDDQSLTQGSGTKGNGVVVKAGSGALTLSAANTYTGG